MLVDIDTDKLFKAKASLDELWFGLSGQQYYTNMYTCIVGGVISMDSPDTQPELRGFIKLIGE